jgi:uncharacterized membrane protein YtjA (UPF0391 family)
MLQEPCQGLPVAKALRRHIARTSFLQVPRNAYKTMATSGRRAGETWAHALLPHYQLHPFIHSKEYVMLSWALAFFIIAIIAAVFGFTGIAAGAAEIAKILFVVFVVLFLVSLVAGMLRRP